MNLQELRLRFRHRADDLQEPYLWGDDEIDAYMNEAQAEAAERAWLLFDESSPDITAIFVSRERGSRYELHPLILIIDSIKVAGDSCPLRHIGIDELDQLGSDWQDDCGSPSSYMRQGETLTIYPLPQKETMLRIKAYRLPIWMANDFDKPEIHQRFHERLIDWALFRAFSKPDADAESLQRADRALTAFIGNFGQRDDADVERQKAEKRRPIARINNAWAAGHGMMRRKLRRGRYW